MLGRTNVGILIFEDMTLDRTVKVTIREGEQSGYVAECLTLPVVTQGATLDETVENLREAIALHLDGEDLHELGLAPPLTVLVLLELEPAHV